MDVNDTALRPENVGIGRGGLPPKERNNIASNARNNCIHYDTNSNRTNAGQRRAVGESDHTMKARLVQNIDGQWLTSEFEAADLIPSMEAKGFKHTGFNSNPRQRAELQGQPKFLGVLGPMWDGDSIRYEDQAAYDSLSI